MSGACKTLKGMQITQDIFIGPLIVRNPFLTSSLSINIKSELFDTNNFWIFQLLFSFSNCLFLVIEGLWMTPTKNKLTTLEHYMYMVNINLDTNTHKNYTSSKKASWF